MKNTRVVIPVVICLLLLPSTLSITGKSCKDIVVSNDATAGDYQLLLKVRDPSRPGLQVLCMVPKGYSYTYQHPWSGKPLPFTVAHTFIGVATLGDTIPEIVKAGMTLSDAGLAFGDADTMSNWRNPTRYAWDDFDWIRYACQTADDEEKAVSLLTKDVVDQFHASGVSENLFVVGPRKGFVIEADNVRYTVHEIDGVLAMSNYPKELWKTQYHKRLPIAPSFDTVVEKIVRKGQVVHLDSYYGVKIVDIDEKKVLARQVPLAKLTDRQIRFMGTTVETGVGERKTVGDYSVTVEDITKSTARITVSTAVNAWEQTLLDRIQPRYGCITVKDMMNWSRLHSEDLNGVRPMCEDLFPYECAMIFKIPEKNFKELGAGWFAANHACSSIYVPVHIADTEIFGPFTNGDAAQLSLDLLHMYGHGNLTTACSTVEDVFLGEIQEIEQVAAEMIENNSDCSEFLTMVDMGMQEQAWLTMQLWKMIGSLPKQTGTQEIRAVIDNMWGGNYSVSLEKMEQAVSSLQWIPDSKDVINQIIAIEFSICRIRVAEMKATGIQEI